MKNDDSKRTTEECWRQLQHDESHFIEKERGGG